ncbi:MAG: glutathione transferase GstA [Gammaproteobacteria bacterium]|nr:glutathione transferase GstA [Gammaproteobacteria bacterium]
MKLYYTPGVCSLSPHIVAREAGIPLDLIKVDIKTHKTEAGEDYYAINPRGYVPVLELEDGTRMREGAVLVQFLADKAPTTGLLPPAGSVERLQVQEWLTYIGTELHKQFYWLFHSGPDDVQKAQRAKIAKGLAELDAHFATRQYLMGDRFTVADAYAFTIVSWCNWSDIDLTPYPHLGAFLARVAARPKVQEALRAEGLLKN